MRCFLSAEIEDKIKENVWNIAKHFKDESTKLVSKDQYHVTLNFLGEISAKRVKTIRKKLDTLDWEGFESKVKGVGVFSKMSYIKVIWAGLTGDFKPLVKKLDKITENKRKRPFHPHITMARVKRKPPEKLKKLIKESKNKEFGRQKIDTIKLKKSILKPDGPVYKDMKTVKP